VSTLKTIKLQNPSGASSNIDLGVGGEVLIGSASTTGTASQTLQVTGGAYVSGRLGIGITSPSKLLHLKGNNEGLRIEDGSATDGYDILRNDTTGFLDFKGDQTSFSGYRFFTNNTSERLTILNAGNIGVGNTTPSELLSVGTAADNKAYFCKSDKTHYVVGQGPVGVPAFEVYSQHGSDANRMSFAVSDNRIGSKSYSFSVNGGGNVGVGITNTTWNGLHLYGDKSLLSGPNSGWGAYLVLGGNGNSSTTSRGSISVTNGNIHLDAATGGYGVYLNWYSTSTTGTFFGNGSSGQVARIDGSGALSKTSGSFRIPHPLPEKTDTHDLVHSFVESPNADNLYSGMVTLINGRAEINLDEVSRMTEGTFLLLNRNLRRFVTNESGWTPVKSSIIGNILLIESQDNTCTDECFWMVIGERHDQHMYDTEWTDENARVIVEPLREIYSPPDASTT